MNAPSHPEIQRVMLFSTHVAAVDDAERRELTRLAAGEWLTVEHRPLSTELFLVALVNGGTVVGWIPGSDTECPARLLMAGKRLAAQVTDLETFGRRLSVRIALYLLEPASPPRVEPTREGLPARLSDTAESPTSPAAARSAAHEGGLPGREARGALSTPGGVQ